MKNISCSRLLLPRAGIASALFIADVAAASAAHAQAEALEISLTTRTPNTVAVPFEQVSNKQLKLKVGSATTNVVLYPATGSVAVQRAGACRLVSSAAGELNLNAAVMTSADSAAGNGNCSEFFSSPDSKRMWLIAEDGKPAVTTLDLQLPDAPAGFEANMALSGLVKLGKGITPASPNCYYQGPTGWTAANCASGQIPATVVRIPAERYALAVKLDAGKGPTWYRVPVKDEVSVGAPPADLSQACAQEVINDKADDGDELYVVCANVANLDKGGGASIILRHSPKREPGKPRTVTITDSGYRVRTRVPMRVYVWGGASPVQIDVDGKEGDAPITYSDKTVYKAEGGAGMPKWPARKDIGKQAGQTLTIKLTAKVSDKETPSVQKIFTVENLYRSALRVGLGLAWSPWAREVGVRTTAGGTKYTVITDGNGPVRGLFAPELVFSYSVFFGSGVSDVTPGPGVGLNFGLGVLKAGSSGPSAMSSARVGLEFSWGLDYSIVFAAGIHHQDVPKDGYQPGTALPNSSDTTPALRYGITPGFGVVFNVTPSVLKAAGILAGG